MNIYDFNVSAPGDVKQAMADKAGKVLLIVNTASKCGFTPQYEGLEVLYKKYHAQGLDIMVFPCNQFGAQEPGSAEEIKNFCTLKYDVSFPLLAKVDVNGKAADPLWDYLKQQQAGLMGSRAIKWNFTKFLVDRSGKVVARHGPQVKPEALEKDIQKLLG
jgi:glutathione peroxidase